MDKSVDALSLVQRFVKTSCLLLSGVQSDGRNQIRMYTKQAYAVFIELASLSTNPIEEQIMLNLLFNFSVLEQKSSLDTMLTKFGWQVKNRVNSSLASLMH